MVEQLEVLAARYQELEQLLADPAVIADQARFRELAREHARLETTVARYREYQKVQRELAEARTLLRQPQEPEFRELVEEEVRRLEAAAGELQAELRRLLIPPDPDDDKNVLVEIRAGTGGEEAALFAADLFWMYSRYAERNGWDVEVTSAHETDLGGFKEVVFLVEGKGAWRRLKFEAGVHRVQRIPRTESGGRIHTSTATVAVLPEAEDVEVEIDPDDLSLDFFRAGGAGGQHVNKTESAVRIIHLPTGITAECQDERSQHKNREKAMRVLRSRLSEFFRRQQQEELDRARRAQVGTGERAEKARTYNFPENRVTDHRVGLTLYKLNLVLEGDLEELVDALVADEEARKLGRASVH